ncbi:MAG: ABC transporter permease [Oscillospiraceae bacterium]|nr:ABC transporter permease [Oscillospiraceae bacterium]
MYILKNAWKNLGRNKGRNILLGIIILAIIATSAVALIINNTAGGIIDNYKQRFDSEVSITPNFEKIQPVQTSDGRGAMLSRMQMPEISPELYIDFSDSDYLSKANYYSSVGVHKNTDITFIGEEKGGGGAFMIGMRINDDGNTEEDPSLYYAKLLGYNYVPEDFESGMRQIAGGNFPENENECVVSRDFYEINGFQIGDTITLTSTLSDRNGDVVMPGEEDTREKISISYMLKIVGYYDDLTDEYAGDFMQTAYDNRRNEIYTTVNTVIEPLADGFSGINVYAKYYLKNPADLEKFAAELYEKGLSDQFDVTTDETGYNTIVKPVEGLKSITLVFLVVVLLLGAIILILLSTIAIRERKYEIGVLRAMGMKKSKVAFGLLSEVIMITILCLVIGMGTGIVTAQKVSDILLENQLKNIEEQSNNGIMTYGPGGNVIRGATVRSGMMIGNPMGGSRTPAEALKEMDVSLNIVTVAEIVLVSLLLAIMASIMGITHITRYEPIKILSERN